MRDFILASLVRISFWHFCRPMECHLNGRHALMKLKAVPCRALQVILWFFRDRFFCVCFFMLSFKGYTDFVIVAWFLVGSLFFVRHILFSHTLP